MTSRLSVLIIMIAVNHNVISEQDGEGKDILSQVYA
jgi:hypothetical protein